jgi:hypothetical protein
METLQILHIFLYYYDVEPPSSFDTAQSFWEWTHINVEKSLAEFCAILLEEHLQVVLDVGGGNLFRTLVSKGNQSV